MSPFHWKERAGVNPCSGSIRLVFNFPQAIGSSHNNSLSGTQRSLLPLQSLLSHLGPMEEKPAIYFHVCGNLLLKYVTMKSKRLDTPLSTFELYFCKRMLGQ